MLEEARPRPTCTSSLAGVQKCSRIWVMLLLRRVDVGGDCVKLRKVVGERASVCARTENGGGVGGWEWATCVISGHNVPFHVRSTTTTAQSSRLLCTQRLFTPYVTQCYTLTWVLSVALGIFDSNSQINPKVTILSVCSASLSLVVVSHTLI